MLKNVTWGDFITAAAILTALYYLVISVGYLRGDVVSLLSKLQKKGVSAKKGPDQDGGKPVSALSSIEELEGVVTDLHQIMKKAGNPADSGELLRQLSQRLANYSGLSIPAYRVALNNYIIQDASETCDVLFTEQELNDTWDSLSP